MRRPAEMQPEEICRTASRVAVLEGIVDPTNVGAIFRSAAALGMEMLNALSAVKPELFLNL